MIEMSHVSKTYKVSKRDAGAVSALKSIFHREYEQVHALKDVSFTIQDGEMVGYIGPNGAGKRCQFSMISIEKCMKMTFGRGKCFKNLSNNIKFLDIREKFDYN